MRKLRKDRVYRHMGRGIPTKRTFRFWMDDIIRTSDDPGAYIDDTLKAWSEKIRLAHPRTLFKLRLEQADWMSSYPGELVIFAEMIEKGERKRGTLPPSRTGSEGAREW